MRSYMVQVRGVSRARQGARRVLLCTGHLAPARDSVSLYSKPLRWTIS
jgi:hypothetical protein